MAREKTKEEDRQARWEELLEHYKKQNPAKFEAKKAAGQFNKIPDDFK